MSLRRVAVFLLALVALCSVAASAALNPAKRGSKSTLPITVRFAPPETCEVSVADQEFGLPADQDRMIVAMSQARRRWRAASIIGGSDIPYRCIGFAIYLAQRGGFKKVGFTAEPPRTNDD